MYVLKINKCIYCDYILTQRDISKHNIEQQQTVITFEWIHCSSILYFTLAAMRHCMT